MKIEDLSRPDKIFISGLETLTGVNLNMYSRKRSEAKGKAQLTFIGEQKLADVQTQLFEFDEETFNVKEGLLDFDFLNDLQAEKVYWLNFHGIHDVNLIEQLQGPLTLDRLVIRQILDTTQIPKADEYPGYLFFSVKSVLHDDEGSLILEQLSFVLGPNYVISFQELIGDHFDDIRSKIRENLGWIRKRNADYLLVQLLDAILDNYFETIESLNESIRGLETETMTDPKKETLVRIEGLKKRAELIKKSISPFSDALSSILNEKTTFVNDTNRKYFLDLNYSSTNALAEVDASFRALESLANIYFASLSQKMNEVMKVLTLVATIFIPLTFIAGIYGMNFQYMPELEFKYGYFAVWGVMIVLLVGMLIFFKRRNWL
jgi:magnesium transporter